VAAWFSLSFLGFFSLRFFSPFASASSTLSSALSFLSASKAIRSASILFCSALSAFFLASFSFLAALAAALFSS
jgi:hypothetical protein